MQKLTMTVKEMAQAVGVSIPTAYAMTHRADFPLLTVGRRRLIPIAAFESWLNESWQQNQTLK